jgi:hypothetical protein
MLPPAADVVDLVLSFLGRLVLGNPIQLQHVVGAMVFDARLAKRHLACGTLKPISVDVHVVAVATSACAGHVEVDDGAAGGWRGWVWGLQVSNLGSVVCSYFLVELVVLRFCH